MAYEIMFPELTRDWGDDFSNKCPVDRFNINQWESNLRRNGYISKIWF